MEKIISTDTVKLCKVMDQTDLGDIYRTFHSQAKEYTFFSAPHGTFSKTGHIIGHKTGLSRYRKIEIIPCIISDDHGLRLVFSSNKNNRKHAYTCTLNSALPNDSLVKEEI